MYLRQMSMYINYVTILPHFCTFISMAIKLFVKRSFKFDTACVCDMHVRHYGKAIYILDLGAKIFFLIDTDVCQISRGLMYLFLMVTFLKN